VYLCSNATSTLHQYFDRIPGSECFDGKIVSADVRLLKPQHEIYEKLFETFGLKPEECFFIDDSPLNIDGAYAVGMPAVLFRDDMAKLRADLRAAGVPVRE
jgi:putative hydrolase of the HAD superfamily